VIVGEDDCVCIQPVWFGSDVGKHCSWKKFGLEDLQLYVCCILFTQLYF